VNLGFAHTVLLPHAILHIHASINNISLKKADELLDAIEAQKEQ
jgi:hypothetical protein